MVTDKTQKETLLKIAKRHGITYREVEEIYASPFRFMNAILNKVPIKEAETGNELRELKTNFNLPRFGKLYLNIPKTMAIKNRINKKKNEQTIESKSETE